MILFPSLTRMLILFRDWYTNLEHQAIKKHSLVKMHRRRCIVIRACRFSFSLFISSKFPGYGELNRTGALTPTEFCPRFWHRERKNTGDQSPAGDFCDQLANKVRHMRARFAIAIYSDVKPIVSQIRFLTECDFFKISCRNNINGFFEFYGRNLQSKNRVIHIGISSWTDNHPSIQGDIHWCSMDIMNDLGV